MGFRLLRPELSAAEQPQQLGVSGAEPVVGQRLPGGEITQPYGRIAQRGRKQDMGHDPGRKQPRGHLVVPWCGRVDAAKSTLYAFPGVFAAAAYPWPFGDTGGHFRLQLTQSSRRISDDRIRPEACGEMIIRQGIFGGGQLAPGQVCYLQERFLEEKFSRLERWFGLSGHNDNIDVGTWGHGRVIRQTNR